METLVVSKAVYDDIMSRRIGREAISTTLQRELKPKAKKCKQLEDLERWESEPTCTLDELKKELGL